MQTIRTVGFIYPADNEQGIRGRNRVKLSGQRVSSFSLVFVHQQNIEIFFIN